jgi:hypothetical protein
VTASRTAVPETTIDEKGNSLLWKIKVGSAREMSGVQRPTADFSSH